jgi:hypothetical protein
MIVAVAIPRPAAMGRGARPSVVTSIPIDTATGRQAGSRVHDTMSADLYATCLIWYGPRGGIAKLHGRSAKLTTAPRIDRLRVECIDYRPQIGERRIQLHAEGWRDMTAAEVARADDYLRGLLPV